MSDFSGILSLVMCAFFWSTGGIFVKNVKWDPMAISAVRSIIAFLLICILKRTGPVFFERKTDGSGKTDGKATAFLWLSGISYAATMILYIAANKLTTAANTILLQYTNPIWLILFTPFILKEKNRISDYLCVLGVTAGMILFFKDGLKAGNQTGNILAALSGLCYAFTIMFMRNIREEHSTGGFMLAHLITFTAGLPFIILTIAKGEGPDTESMIFLVLLGILQMGIPSITFSYGIKRVKALTAAFITMIEPLFNPVWVAVFDGEMPGFYCILGGVLILVSILIRTVWQSRKNTAKTAES